MGEGKFFPLNLKGLATPMPETIRAPKLMVFGLVPNEAEHEDSQTVPDVRKHEGLYKKLMGTFW